jgi:EF hand
MPLRLCLISVLANALTFASAAQGVPAPDPAIDEIVRLPGQGQVKPGAGPRMPERLVPGGGLILSFDQNKDGRISRAEISSGAALAFTRADANQDGALTAIEQQIWAGSLPSLDDSLANPVRFDPNLDRSASRTEFVTVIVQLAAAYVDAASGDISLARLTAPDDARPQRGFFGVDIAPRQF